MSHCYVFFISFDYIINGISMILLIKIYIYSMCKCLCGPHPTVVES